MLADADSRTIFATKQFAKRIKARQEHAGRASTAAVEPATLSEPENRGRATRCVAELE